MAKAKEFILTKRNEETSSANAFAQMLGGAPAAGKDTIQHLPLEVFEYDNDQPFHLYPDEEFEKLVESVKNNGVIQPITARPIGDGKYQIVMGRHRHKASVAAGLSAIPTIIRELDDDTAFILQFDSDTIHRKDNKPSELAFGYRKRLEIENRQGHRSDLASRQIVARMDTAEKRKAQRYARLTNMVPALLALVDDGAITKQTADPLCDLEEQEQHMLLGVLAGNGNKITVEQAARLNELSKAGELDDDSMGEIFAKPGKAAPTYTSYKLPSSVNDYFKGAPKKEVQQKIYQILEEYFSEQT